MRCGVSVSLSLREMAEYFRRLYSIRDDIDRCLDHLKQRHPDATLDESDSQYVRQVAEQLQTFFERYGFEHAVRAAVRIQAKTRGLTSSSARQRFEELWEDYLSDCDDRRVEIIRREVFKYYDADVSHEVRTRFPNASAEMREGGTCHALGRY